MLYKIASYDPGRTRDGFGMLGATVDTQRINIHDATAWYGTDTTNVADDIAVINKEVGKFDYHICETNNQGHVVMDLLRRYHQIHCTPVTAVRDVKKKSKLKYGRTMPKNITVEWVEWARQKGILLMPKKSTWTPGIRLLQKQLENYIRKPSGDTSKYQAADDDMHDDLVACLLLLCHWARINILRVGYIEKPPIAHRRSKAYDSIRRALKSQADIESEQTLDSVENRIRGRIPGNAEMTLFRDGVAVGKKRLS